MPLGAIHPNLFKTDSNSLKSILILLVFFLSLYGLSSIVSATVGPFFYNNATNVTGTTEYEQSSVRYYVFQVNITNETVGGTGNVSNGTIFQLGGPGGTYTNYTRLTTPAVTNQTNGFWWINFTSQDQFGRVGTYNYTWYGNTTANVFNASNFSATPTNKIGDVVFTIARNPRSVITLLIDGTAANKTYELSKDIVNLTATSNATDNITAEPGLSGLHIFTNFTGSNASITVSNMTTASSVYNTTNISTLWQSQSCKNNCYFIFSSNHTQSQNYTVETNDTIFLVLKDTTAPTISSFKLIKTDNIYVGDTLKSSDFSCSATDLDSASVSITDLATDAAGDKTAKCEATDPSGNKATLTTTYVVVAKGAVQSTSAPSASATSSPQSGSAKVFIQKVSANGVATVTINKTIATQVNEIKISVSNDVLNLYVNVVKLAEKPATVQAPTGTVLTYLDLSVDNLKQADIANATVDFYVPKTWIQQNNIDENKVYLNRFANDQWNRLESNKLREDNEFVYYQAKTPGFSVFSISGEQKVAAPEQPPAPATPPTEQPTQPEAPREVPTKAPTVGVGMIATIVVIVIAAAAVIFYLQRKQKAWAVIKRKYK